MKSVHAIVAVASDWAIGRQGGLLCHLPADMRHFKEVTMGHSIVMGRKTFESFPKGPLPGRQNIVVTRNRKYRPEGVTVAHTIDAALRKAEMPGEVFIIGGAQLYAATIDRVSMLYLTQLHATFDDADAFFPAIDPEQWQVLEQEAHQADNRNPYDYTFVKLVRNE